MEFEGIGSLNVITGPNGVGKSRLLEAINDELKNRKEDNIIPVYFKFSVDNVVSSFKNKNSENDMHTFLDESNEWYKNEVDKLVKEHSEYCKKNLFNDDFNRNDEIYIKNKKSYNRYLHVYKKKNYYEQMMLQMQYELGMSCDDMKDENSIFKYLHLHKLIKFSQSEDDNDNAAIDINEHLKNNNFKYMKIVANYNADSAEPKYKAESYSYFAFEATKEKVLLNKLSSGERTYFNLLLWSLIHKINTNLKKPDKNGVRHKGLVRNGANFVFLLGKFH